MNHAHHIISGTDKIGKNKVCDTTTDPQVVISAEAETGGIDTIDCGECLARIAAVCERLAAALRARIDPAAPAAPRTSHGVMPIVGGCRGGVHPGQCVEVATDDPRGRKRKVLRLVVAKVCAAWRIDRLEIDGRDLLHGRVLYGSDLAGMPRETAVEYSAGFVFLVRATNMTDATAQFFACWLVDLDPDLDAPRAHHPECNDDRCGGGC